MYIKQRGHLEENMYSDHKNNYLLICFIINVYFIQFSYYLDICINGEIEIIIS